MPVEATPDHIRVRVRDPGLFKDGSFRTVIFSESQGIKTVMARLKSSNKFVVQAYLFVRAKGWTKSKATTWVKEHTPKKKMKASSTPTPPANPATRIVDRGHSIYVFMTPLSAFNRSALEAVPFDDDASILARQGPLAKGGAHAIESLIFSPEKGWDMATVEAWVAAYTDEFTLYDDLPWPDAVLNGTTPKGQE